MRTLAGLTMLSVVLCLSLACSSGEGVPGNSVTTFKTPIPYNIRTSFKSVPGGALEQFAVPVDETFFNDLGESQVVQTMALNPNYGQDASVTSFNMMDSEVTIQMFADFMNNLEKNYDDLFESTETIVNSSGEEVSVLSITFTRPSLSIYKPVMQDAQTCGIYMLDQFGRDISGEIQTTVGFTFGKPELTKGYVDPMAHYVGKPRGATKGIRFEVAPGREHFPMVFVTRDDAKQFARWLGSGFRLPTAIEFQYAGRGGKRVDFATSTGGIYRVDENGDNYINPSTNQPEYLANIQGEFSQNGGTTRVKSFPANPYGLHDLTGNVYEWTVDQFEDVSASSSGFTPILGGSFASTFLSAGTTWATMRTASSGVWATDLGFRLVYKGSLQTVGDTEVTYAEPPASTTP